MTKLLIKITPEVLERAKMCGIENTGENCAIAIAVRDIFPKAWIGRNLFFPFCDKSGGKSNTELDVDLPYEATRFITHFDSLTPLERVALPPFSFTVTLPDEVVERIDISQVWKSETLELV
jgi:hypothetical protein